MSAASGSGTSAADGDGHARLLLLPTSLPAREAFDALDALVGRHMESAGGPPAGLMSHVVYQEKDALVVADVWRTEVEGLTYIDEVLRPLIADAGLTAHEMSVHEVWSPAPELVEMRALTGMPAHHQRHERAADRPLRRPPRVIDERQALVVDWTDESPE